MRGRSLRRRTDRIEDAAAWLLTAAGLIVVLAAGVLGYDGYRQELDRARAEQATHARVTAVLLADPPQIAAERAAPPPPFLLVPARWTDQAGRQHEGQLGVPPSARSGQQIPVWVDGGGQLAAPPADELGAVCSGLVVTVGLLLLGGGLIGTAWAGLRYVIFAGNTRRWEREWARVGPEWTSQHPS